MSADQWMEVLGSRCTSPSTLDAERYKEIGSSGSNKRIEWTKIGICEMGLYFKDLTA
jgi:hypothetical protein